MIASVNRRVNNCAQKINKSGRFYTTGWKRKKIGFRRLLKGDKRGKNSPSGILGKKIQLVIIASTAMEWKAPNSAAWKLSGNPQELLPGCRINLHSYPG
jgi:hypothetical protein